MVGAIVYVVVADRTDLARTARGARPGVLVAVLAAAFVTLAVSSQFWAAALRGLGDRVGWATCMDATLASTPARYVPGSIWYALGRAATLRRQGAHAAPLAAVAALEMILVPVTGFALGGVLVSATAGGGASALAGPGLIAASVVLALCSSPPVVNLALRLLGRWRRTTYVSLTWGLHLQLVGWTCLNWLVQAFVFVLYLHAFPAVSVGGPVHVAGAYMVAWGIGWLAIFAPQGLGVFEAALAAILTGHTPAGLALIIGGYRAVIAVRDGLGFALILGWRRAHGRRWETGLGDAAGIEE